MTVISSLTVDRPNATIRLVLSDGPDTATVYRRNPNGSVVVVRGADAVSVPATGSGDAPVNDYEPPFGPIAYGLAADGPWTVVPAADWSDVMVQPYLSAPLGPWLVMPVRVVDDRNQTWPGRTYIYDVLNRAEPVVTWYTRSTRTGTLVLRYENTREHDAILAALATGSPLLLRIPSTRDGLETSYVAPTDVRVVPVFPGYPRGTVELDYVICAPPSGLALLDPTWTWDAVVAAFATWDDLVAAFDTWTEVVGYAPSAPAPPGFGA